MHTTLVFQAEDKAVACPPLSSGMTEACSWCKKTSNFDVTMGSFDGAEICELVGLFLLSQLQYLNINVGLYRDDGLAVTNQTPRNADKIKKEICKIFKDNGLSIAADANKKVVDFLDVTLNYGAISTIPQTEQQNQPYPP